MKKQTEQEFGFGFQRMIKGISSFLLQEGQLSDSQNMIPTHQGWKQRKGSSELTTTAIASALRFKSMTQFRDLKGNTNVMVAHVYDASNGERVMKQSTLPTSTHLGNTWVEMLDLTASCTHTQWATVAGALIGADSKEFFIWRGEQHLPTGVWKYLDTIDDYVSFFDEMIDGDTTTTMTLASATIGDFFVVMHDQPLNEVSPDVGTANDTTSWLIGEYYNGVWTLLKRASWWSTTEYLDEDCDGTLVAMGWDDDDNNGTTTAPSSFYNRVCIKLDSGAAGAGNFAKISKDVGTLGATCVVSVLANCDNIGLLANVDVFQITVDNGDVLCKVRIGTDGISTYDGASWNEIGDISVTEDEWNVWTLAIDSTTPASATVTVYRNGTQVGVATDCSDTGGTTADGDIILTSLGENTANQITYVRQITVGDTLDTTGDSFSDGTSASSKTLAQDGDITWTAQSDDAKQIIDGQQGYAYRFGFNTTIGASTTIEALDCHQPMATLKNIWDGQNINCVGCYVYDGTDYTDYTIYVNNTSESQYMDLSSLATTEKIYVAFPYRVSRIIFHVAADGKNTADAQVDSVKYHNASGAATSVGTFTDTTLTSTAGFSQKGYIDWIPPAATQEKPIKIGGDDVPWYWYELEVDAALGGTTYVYFIEGVPQHEDPDLCYGCFGWKRRAWQIAPLNRENQVRYSAQNLPNTFNGQDSGYIEFGERPLKCAAPFYNETVLFADTEMWMLQGSSPSNFGRLRLSAQIGCAAPHSVVTIETGVSVGDSIKNVVVWMFYDGIWLFDGVRVMKISAPDIDSFFNPDHDDYIAPAYLDQSYAAYDHETQCVYWTVYSGSAATTPTKVIVLHFPTLWYGILDYSTDMGTITPIWNNRYYLVGGGFATGKSYLLNSGTTDVNTSGTAVAVDAFLVTRDMYMGYSEGLKQRLVSLWTESQEAGGLIEIDEYPDGSKTPRNIAKGDIKWYGRLFGLIQKVLRLHANQSTTKFRIRNRSKNARMNPLGFSATADRGRTDEQ